MKINSLTLLFTIAFLTQSVIAKEMQVFDPPANIRDKPDGKVLCQVTQVDNIETFGKKDQWFFTDKCGSTGVIHESQVKNLVNNSSLNAKEMQIFDPPANIRDKPDGKVLCQVTQVANIKISGKKNEWFSTDKCGTSGFIHESQVRDLNNTTSPPESSPTPSVPSKPTPTPKKTTDCSPLVDDYKSWSACKGDCTPLVDNYKVWSACKGDCTPLVDNYKAWSACKGDCTPLVDDYKSWSACKSCGGGSRWTTLYSLGVLMTCK
ncbi:hypothetical protein [Thiothrix unzii]|jgi:hypothetical protein|uniref:hypothetical protein n=1 Tax=Thiothrix unzii TaxID=111769 RepID=UPI002A365D8F|nr:hypothetical protein [Thiothrix unzii]MDX9988677.1 hypothetical protein [Thiothrix unzii]